MVDFLAGSVAFAFAVAAIFFLRFWKETRDLLFLNFAVAFVLFMLNGIGAVWLRAAEDERFAYVYVLRVVGYVLILFAIVGKNIFAVFKWR